jgi:hypothetical protein
VPAAPTIGTAVAGNANASVAFTPAATLCTANTSYTATSNPGSFTGSGSASPLTVGSLVNGTGYTFTVTATNAVGTGAASGASNSVTPNSSLKTQRSNALKILGIRELAHTTLLILRLHHRTILHSTL